ncbi:MAG: substrate-binding domain-containing protein [Ilumatobacteraceae bacterium]
MNTSRKRTIVAAVAGLALVLAACGADEGAVDPTETNETSAPATDGGSDATSPSGELAAGEVFVTGSSTVEPISVLVSELADQLSGGQLAVTVEGPGTGDGFQKFCNGEADISDASRKIKDEEAALCAEAGIEFVELEIAIDGLTVATNPNNAAGEGRDRAALYALIGPESEGFDSWADANAIAGELGSAYSALPDAPLTVVGPGPESGTYDSFVEFAIKKLAEERGTEDTTRSDYTASPNDNLIVDGIEGSDTSLGWVGYAFYKAEGDKMKGLAIDGGEGCVQPTDESIADGSYPFSRSLYIYVSLNSLAENPAVGSYVDLYLSDDGIASVAEAGYVAIPADRLEAARAAWSAAKA